MFKHDFPIIQLLAAVLLLLNLLESHTVAAYSVSPRDLCVVTFQVFNGSYFGESLYVYQDGLDICTIESIIDINLNVPPGTVGTPQYRVIKVGTLYDVPVNFATGITKCNVTIDDVDDNIVGNASISCVHGNSIRTWLTTPDVNNFDGPQATCGPDQVLEAVYPISCGTYY